MFILFYYFIAMKRVNPLYAVGFYQLILSAEVSSLEYLKRNIPLNFPS